MKAIIVSHAKVTEVGSPELHRFGFTVEDGHGGEPRADFVSLRTARVLVQRLGDGNPFIAMLRAIVNADESQYDGLIGKTFED
jgi:hypothetical protein